MNDLFIIKQASDKYAEEVCEVLIRSITEVCVADHNHDPLQLQEWLANKTPAHIKKWINDNANYSIAVLDAKERVIGFSMMTREGEILLNYLLPEYLYKGIGKLMLNNLQVFARALGVQQMLVRSTVTAKQFYMKNGFIEHHNNDHASIILVKSI